MESVYNIKVDCNSAISNQTGIVLKRGDSGITLAIEVSGLTPGTADASIVFARPTGVVESTDLTRNSNVWSYIIKGTELEYIGKVVADIKFRDDENRISTASFTFYVAEDTLEGAADEPHSYSDTIAQIAERLEGEVDGLTEEVEALSQAVGEAEGRITEVEADVAEIAENMPTKTSDLENDSGFITNEDVPTKLSELEDDATHRTVTDVEKASWDNKSDFSGDYEDLNNKPTIPSKTSDLDNDSNYVSDANYTHTDNNYSDADKAAVDEISGIKQDLTQLDSDVTALTTVVNGKANQSDVTQLGTRVTAIEDKLKTVIYGFHVNSAESDPSTAVTYLEDAVGMTPAHMDYTNGVFNYGSWGNAFFMPRPCMLKTNGTVAYYLDKNDFSKKADGTASDIADTSFDGNVMMEWGRDGQKIWYKLVPDVGDVTSYSVYIANHKVDSTYRAWSFINKDNQLVDHFYTACYTGSLIDGKLRSLSGQNLMNNQSGTAEIGYAKANGDYYNIEHWSDTSLIFLLLYLMGKSLDVQTVFGNGHMSGGSSASDLIPSGQLNDKGLFYGYNDGTHKVKVFGMEDLWGEQWRRTQGLMLNDGTYYYKLTEGTADGGTANGYRTTDTTGMLSGGASPTTNDYVSKMKVVGDTFLPTETAGASNKYYCDYFYQNQSGVRFALLGAPSYNGAYCGLCVRLSSAVSGADWHFGAALSCKPSAV